MTTKVNRWFDLILQISLYLLLFIHIRRIFITFLSVLAFLPTITILEVVNLNHIFLILFNYFSRDTSALECIVVPEISVVTRWLVSVVVTEIMATWSNTTARVLHTEDIKADNRIELFRHLHQDFNVILFFLLRHEIQIIVMVFNFVSSLVRQFNLAFYDQNPVIVILCRR
jgi:hypothetical protein